MPLQDLSRCSGEQSLVADVCIIGAGPVGLALARRLATTTLQVVLLERGGHASLRGDATEPPGFDALPYGGAGPGRAFGYGGTSALWGGQLLPMRSDEFLAADAPSCWPLAAEELIEHQFLLDDWLGVTSDSFQPDGHAAHPLNSLRWNEFAPRMSKWLAFGQRNIARAWHRELQAASNLQIWLNAPVTSFDVRGNAVVGVVAQGTAGKLVVKARFFVAAAGAIESTRLALNLFTHASLQSRRPPALGHYLHDHLSTPIARVTVHQVRDFERLFAPTFIRGRMRSLRIELNPLVQAQLKALPAYAHFVSHATGPSGFSIARDTLRGLQRGELRSSLQALRRAPAVAPELMHLAWSRLVHRRLTFPPRAELFVHLDVVQRPDYDNRIYLDPEAPATDLRAVRIAWRHGDNHREAAEVFGQRLREWWQQNQLGGLASLEFLVSEHADPSNLYDIFHPAGTTRMGHDARDACVDPQLKLFGTDNVYIVGSSVFPQLGAANPTYTAMLLAMRLATHLSQQR